MHRASKLGRIAALVVALASATGATAQEKLLIGGTPNAEPATAMIAVKEGFFSKRGINAEFKLITTNPTIPPALLSNSLQIGLPTPTTFFQAVDNGFDLVIIGGVSATAHTGTGAGIVVRKDGGIASAKDLVGKKFGVPGLNAILHVLVRRWLRDEGVDAKSVNFVESFFPVHGDMLKSGQIDAVVTVDPFLSRITGAEIGAELISLSRTMPEGRPTMMYVTTREWAEKNAKTVKAFREAIEEAAAFIKANPEKAREDIGQTLGLPAPVIKTLELPRVSTTVTANELQWWLDEMKVQGMLRTTVDPAKLILK